MGKSILIILSTIFILSSAVFLSSAANFPKPEGFVTDAAKLLSSNQKTELERTLREYEKSTSIEIAVVTVNSLEGMSIEDYTQELAVSWGVGKRGKNNGVVLLVAPRERKVRIATGYGIEPDLTDSYAKRIIEQEIIPNFKKGNMVSGILAGASGITRILGDKPFKARLEERQAMEERRRLESEMANKKFRVFLTLFIVVAAVLIVLALVIYVFVRNARSHKVLINLHEKIKKDLEKCEAVLSEDIRKHGFVGKKIDGLKSDNPEEIWEDLEKTHQMLALSMVKLEKTLAEYKRLFGADDYKDVNELASSVSNLLSKVMSLSDAEAVDKRIDDLEKAKSQTPKFLQSLPKELGGLEEKLVHPDVTDKSRQLLGNAKVKFLEAEKLSQKLSVNWILVFSAIVAASETLNMAKTEVAHDMAFADEARKNGPKLIKDLPGKISDAEKEVSGSSVSSSAKSMVKDAKDKYEDAKPLVGKAANWVIVYTALLAVAQLLENALGKAKNEKDEERRRQRRRDESSSYYSSSSSDSSWSSGGSSGGGSDSGGGFGGGDFGGGGASESW